jgi:hypothetical protein
MKKLYTILAVLFLTASAFAQAPEKMSYQAVVRDSGDALVTSQPVGMQISILQTTATGTAVYVETQTPTTNVNGLVSLEIGTGTVVSGDFTTIDWSTDSYFIKTETDPAGGTTYTITGTSQLMSVPFALYAKTSGSATPGPQGAQGTPGIQGVTGTSGADGAAGAPGVAGTNGTNGTDGTPGIQGATGADGATGSLGAQGDIGATGAAGINGTDGTQGIQGATGADGANGTDGTQGIQGATGADGSNGTDGTQGIQGATGTSGADGAAGPSGTNGTPGIQGATGADGATGPSGTNGTPGIQGATGADGATGIPTGGTEGQVLKIVGGIPTWVDPAVIGQTFYEDTDNDGYGDINSTIVASAAPNGYVSDNTDCNDTDAAINPATVWFIGVDTDGDTFFGSTTSLTQCEFPGIGYVITAPATLDCDDSLAIGSSINPDAIEDLANGIDDDCDGQVDEATVGELREGGIVFWVDPADNTHGKVCAFEDAPTALNWLDAITYSGSYTNLDTGTGVYSNWYLPSRDELQFMYANLQRFGCSTNSPAGTDVGLCATRKANFLNAYYMSSTTAGSDNVWLQNFNVGNQVSAGKSNPYNVRAVRAF